MTTATCFQFDCPGCRARLAVTAEERGGLITCERCNLEFPAPCFHQDSRTDRPPRRFRPRGYACHCPQCGATRQVLDAGDETECERCGRKFSPPGAPWLRWLRPVARVLTDEDQSRSLHHLMLSTERIWLPDAALEDRARRRFSFYCGACGRVQQARVWEIASQQRCRDCDALMIIPAPHGVQRVPCTPAAAAAPPEINRAKEVLYCPRCGTRCEDADRSRARRTYCALCDHWF